MSDSIPQSTACQAALTQQILKAAAEVGVMGGRGESAQRILALLSNRDADAQAIANVIMREPALAARVLRVANSAMYGQSRSISSIERAIVLLGLEAVRGIAAAACFSRSVPVIRKMSGSDVDSMHRHSLAVAITAEMLARRKDPDLASDAFMAGLFHDLGVAVQLRLDELRNLRSASPEEPSNDDLFEVDHERCTEIILGEWGFPDSLVAAAGHHHDPGQAPQAHRALASFVNVAESLVQSTGLAVFTADLGSEAPADAAVEYIGVSDDELENISANLENLIAEKIQIFESTAAG